MRILWRVLCNLSGESSFHEWSVPGPSEPTSSFSSANASSQLSRRAKSFGQSFCRRKVFSNVPQASKTRIKARLSQPTVLLL
jgi:hypothetical protein